MPQVTGTAVEASMRYEVLFRVGSTAPMRLRAARVLSISSYQDSGALRTIARGARTRPS